ncbi:CapA family protein [Anaeropeptidivorans aminofermentans]|uniref:CapA family protein n=1 Tax=Anaeropeptidivorans aminofermentans TaxID=2934315 RepID=UPI002023D82C|nr:CapA family protein [Anaeropeptidivorans aminofermentans]
MNQETSFIFTGDSFITRRISEEGYEGLGKISEIIKNHQVRFNNLEITIHENEGYPEAQSGGTWAMADPSVLDDLCRYGFNLYNTANNHSSDYGHGGLLGTIRNLKERNLVFAGTGENLALASRPSYLETKNARVALIAVCSTFHPSAAAGNQSPSLKGRPGLNPLRYKTYYTLEEDYFNTLCDIAEKTYINASALKSIKNGYAPPLSEDVLNFGGLSFILSDKTGVSTSPDQSDMERIGSTICEARRQADYVIMSIHAHEDLNGETAVPAEFLQSFSRFCITKGADAVIGHGPHELRAIEIYKEKPIFYSLGNFIFQTETVAFQPADAFEKQSMPIGSTVGEYMDNRSKNGTRGYAVDPNIWLSVMAGFTAADGKIKQIKLYPIDLHMKSPRSQRGLPSIVDGNHILEYLSKLSAPFGTSIEIIDGIGVINL